jgi:hypothetical protein
VPIKHLESKSVFGVNHPNEQKATFLDFFKR